MTDEQVLERLNSDKNILNKLGKGHGLGGNNSNHDNAGRKSGDENLTPFMREVISAAAQLDTAKSVGSAFGISKAHAHNLKNGYVTRPNGKSGELLNGKRKKLDEIQDRASDLVLETLGLLTPTKLKEIDKAKDITAVAKDLATVIEKASPEKGATQNNAVQVIIHAPGQLKESHFETIDVIAEEIV